MIQRDEHGYMIWEETPDSSRHVYEVCRWCGRSSGDYWVYPASWVRTFEPSAVSVEVDELIGDLAERRKEQNGPRGDAGFGGVGEPDAF